MGGQAFAAGKGVQGLAQSVWFNGLLQPAGPSWRQALVGGLQSEMQNLQVLHSPGFVFLPVFLSLLLEFMGVACNWVVHLWVGESEAGLSWQGALVGGLQSKMQNLQVLHSLFDACFLCSF